jgi:hypothetical protein
VIGSAASPAIFSIASLTRALSATAASKALRAKSPCSLKKSVAVLTSEKPRRAAEASSKL